MASLGIGEGTVLVKITRGGGKVVDSISTCGKFLFCVNGKEAVQNLEL